MKKRMLAILLALCMTLSLMNVAVFASTPEEGNDKKYEIEIGEDEKFKVVVASRLPNGEFTEVVGTVDKNYFAKLKLPNASVNAGNVTIAVAMQNIASMDIGKTRSHSITLNTGIEDYEDVDLLGHLGDLKNFEGAAIKATIIGSKDGEADERSVTYTLVGGVEEEGYDGQIITGTPGEGVSEAWQLLASKDHFAFKTGEDNSYIKIVNGSWLQIGTEVLRFADDYDSDLILDDFTGDNIDKDEIIDAIQKAVTLDENAAPSSLAFVLKKGTTLAVGSSSAELLKDVRVDVTGIDFEALAELHALAALRDEVNDDSTGAKELIVDLVSILNSVVHLVDETDETIEVKIEFGCIHIPGAAVKENEVEATCTAEGSYDEVVYCTICKEEISRETKTTEKVSSHTPGAAVKENEVEATCAAEGSYDEVVYCTICKEEISRETKTTEKAPHTPGEAAEENRVEATATTAGSYDLVTRCTACGEVLNSERRTIPATGSGTTGSRPTGGTTHTHYDWNNDHECDVDGTTMTSHADEDADHICDICGEPITDHADEDADHICDICGETMTDHVDEDADHICDICGETMTDHVDEDADHICDTCGEPITDHVDDDGDDICDICGEPMDDDIIIDDEDVPLAGKPFLFTDVAENEWYYDYVKTVYEKDLMVGINDTTFDPKSPTTRGMVAQVLYNMEGKPSIDGYDVTIPDLKSTDWYYEAAIWAYATGVYKGYEDGSFHGDDEVTREQLMIVLYRYARKKDYDVSALDNLSAFMDKSSISGWALEGAQWAVGTGLVRGRSGNQIMPGSNTLRAELATILVRFVDAYIDIA